MIWLYLFWSWATCSTGLMNSCVLHGWSIKKGCASRGCSCDTNILQFHRWRSWNWSPWICLFHVYLQSDCIQRTPLQSTPEARSDRAPQVLQWEALPIWRRKTAVTRPCQSSLITFWHCWNLTPEKTHEIYCMYFCPVGTWGCASLHTFTVAIRVTECLKRSGDNQEMHHHWTHREWRLWSRAQEWHSCRSTGRDTRTAAPSCCWQPPCKHSHLHCQHPCQLWHSHLAQQHQTVGWDTGEWI